MSLEIERKKNEKSWVLPGWRCNIPNLWYWHYAKFLITLNETSEIGSIFSLPSRRLLWKYSLGIKARARAKSRVELLISNCV